MADALVGSGGTSAGDVNGLLAGSGYQFSSAGWSWTWNSFEMAADQVAASFANQGAANLTFSDIGIASASGNGATYYAGVWAAPVGGSSGGSDSSGGSTPVNITSERLDDMRRSVNNFRSSYGVCNVRINDSLAQAAVRHSEDMARNDSLVHNGSDGSSHISRAQDAGYSTTWVAENIAGQPGRNDDGAFQSWVNSTLGHRENMLNSTFDDIGIAVAGPSASGVYYYTMVLGSQGSGC
jgi:uncharacterized protein YkwD